jgi:pimeloyl-ACP methyl ester carboxylesterase
VSERPSSANASAPWLLTIGYYVTELQAVADTVLGSHQRFHLLGSSWGTVVAQEYALQTPPPSQLAGLLLSGPLSDGQLYINSQWDEIEGGLGTLPYFTQQRIRALEATPGGFRTEA